MSDIIATLIQEVASLQEEAERVCKPIEDSLMKARANLKDALTEADQREAIDETSGYRAYIRETHADEYVAEKLVPLLPRPELADEVIVTSVDGAAVKRLVDLGILTRSRLEQEGALVRRLRARALYVERL